jgi:ABC-2 type transport system permease protein
MKLLRDTSIVFGQQMRLMSRSPSWVVMGIVQPVLYLVLFAPLLRTALNAPSTSSAYATFVPGLLVLLVMGASLYAGIGLINEVRNGSLDRCRVTPVSRTALLLGRTTRDVLVFVVQAIIVVTIATAAGLRANVLGILAAMAVLAVISMTLSSVSYLMALGAAHEGAMSGMIGMITQPLILLSGVMLPLTLAPGWLRDIAHWNPFSYVVAGSRDMFVGSFGTAAVWQAAVITVGLAVLVIGYTSHKFARAVS